MKTEPNKAPSNRLAKLERSAKKMKLNYAILILPLILFGCTTNDFRAVDSLHEGMQQSEVRSNIEKFGFTSREPELERPKEGWPETEQTYLDVPWRAALAEKKIQKPIYFAEAYPVTHGLLGCGWIYLFYDSDRTLIHYYRLQIN